jgi:hypothetical protein
MERSGKAMQVSAWSGDARRVVSRRCLSRYGRFFQPLSRLASVRCRERGAASFTVRQDSVRCGELCRVWLSLVEASFALFCWRLDTTYTVGVVAASMPQGGMSCGALGWGQVGSIRACPVY